MEGLYHFDAIWNDSGIIGCPHSAEHALYLIARLEGLAGGHHEGLAMGMEVDYGQLVGSLARELRGRHVDGGEVEDVAALAQPARPHPSLSPIHYRLHTHRVPFKIWMTAVAPLPPTLCVKANSYSPSRNRLVRNATCFTPVAPTG